jgi:putative addiction module component (TIGR02574 family)
MGSTRATYFIFLASVEMSTDSLFDLSPPEKLQLVEDLWDDLAATPSDIPVHPWQQEELARRKANLLSKQTSGVTWDEIKLRIRSRYGR